MKNKEYVFNLKYLGRKNSRAMGRDFRDLMKYTDMCYGIINNVPEKTEEFYDIKVILLESDFEVGPNRLEERVKYFLEKIGCLRFCVLGFHS